MHFGYFIAGCTNDVIANFEATMANILLMSGYSPKRWQKPINCMLLKQEGNYNVDKLHTIVLFHPEANQNFKFLGRTVMAHAENHGQLACTGAIWKPKKENSDPSCSQQATQL
jgi:hypothetical protein